MAEAFAIHTHDGVLSGPVRTPRNSAKHAGAGSIHDDSTAQKLGFRGGTVAGSLHMEQFPPLLTAAFGERWLESGGLSLYFKFATTDGEAVQAHVRAPRDPAAANAQTDVWMDDVRGNRVCDGTASVGAPDLQSALRKRIAEVPEPTDIRILKSIKPGDQSGAVSTRLTNDALARRLEVITEPLAAYRDASIYGHTIATPAMQVQVLRPADAKLLTRGTDFGVGLFGAIELQLLNGPVFVGYEYTVNATVLAVGETPKTEYFWYESILSDPKNGKNVLSMLMMLRFMKASSKLWQ